MAEDPKPDTAQDTSKPGREEEVKSNNAKTSDNDNTADATALPVKGKQGISETEGERRFKEGLANNNDTE